ncbi:TcfC E-set like domain-containing protein [Klebsiella aerogenes]
MAYIKTIVYSSIILTINYAYSSVQPLPVRVNDVIIPSIFATALSQGMTVPVFIRYRGNQSTERSRQKIANAILTIKDNKFVLGQVTLVDGIDSTELSTNVKSVLEGIKDKEIGDSKRIRITEGAVLSLDTTSFYIELEVDKKSLQAKIIPRANMLKDSSSNNISTVLDYSIGSYYSKDTNSNNGSSYITLDNTWALREHHINLNGTIYGIGTSSKHGELYRSMYERDYQGNRFAIGMVDTWNLQSIASMSALNSSRIYGASYGNKSSSRIEDNTLSLTPVTIFLPSAGEVHISRDGKLLSIQNFEMGSYEIDTSHLPFGIYNVDIQVIVNGKIVSSRVANINKTYARVTSLTDDLSWQVFGGSLKYNDINYQNHHNINNGVKDTWLVGMAAATNKKWFSGTDLKTTLYGFDTNGVSESEINVFFNDMINYNQQMLLSNDMSWQSISTINLNLPEGYGSIWGSRQLSHIVGNLPLQQSDYISAGVSSNLQKFSHFLGTLSISRTDNRYYNNVYTNIDYNQSLFSNRYASVSLRTGIQRYQYNKNEEVSDKYINIDVSIPFSTWLTTGLSSQNGDLLANATVRKRFEDSVIKQVGTSVSKKINNNNKSNSGYQNDNVSLNGYVNYDTKNNTGMISLSRSSEHNSNISLSSQGSLGWTQNNLYFGKGNHTSGIVINTNFMEQGRALAQINGQNYTLTGKNNYISLPPYTEYKIELMNDKKTEDSVEIVNGRKSNIVLYPGNITIISPEIKQLVTVFGRVKNNTGGYYANTDIHNHIGKTQTDGNGEFAMDVDRRYPVITVIDKKGGLCEADLNLKDAKGAVWLGDIQCKTQILSASNNEVNYSVN